MAAAPDPPQSSGSTGDGDNNGLGLLAYWIIAGAITAYLGYGRSHGNSVDSDDSTAMSVTLATDKVLASCRLDYVIEGGRWQSKKFAMSVMSVANK
ncbi:unnamed protein product [Peronospora farinosa]|uniref:Uncharacterized protein n=1 Tax=Peronospora farinosa TaxID=134698 RepID=A0ABN8BT56_9STRA|nr:unnamed protein product [Peronospora farinosa]